MKIFLVFCLAVVLAGCSTSPDKISAEYVSSSKYLSLSCDQIRSNLATAESRANTMYDQLQSARTKDETAMAIGLIIFWPALFFIDGDSPDVQTYAQLQGEVLALAEASRQNGC